jgi:hypothetical protein
MGPPHCRPSVPGAERSLGPSEEPRLLARVAAMQREEPVAGACFLVAQFHES